MTKVTISAISLTIVFALLPGAAQAQSARTYVSGTGQDGGSCSQAQPCRTFKAALTLTAAGGEIYVLNSADYGPATINKSVTITSQGAVAGVRATSGTAITISAGASDAINLYGLNIDGGSSAGTGIQFNSGRSLSIQKSSIRNFTQAGLSFSPTGTSALFGLDTTVTQNGKNGILLSNAATAALSRVAAFANGVGILATGSGVNATLSDVVASNNNYGIGASAAAVMVRNAMVSNNVVGVAADTGAIIRIGSSTVTGNGTGWQATNGAQIQSYSTNNLAGNTTDGAATKGLSLQ